MILIVAAPPHDKCTTIFTKLEIMQADQPEDLESSLERLNLSSTPPVGDSNANSNTPGSLDLSTSQAAQVEPATGDDVDDSPPAEGSGGRHSEGSATSTASAGESESAPVVPHNDTASDASSSQPSAPSDAGSVSSDEVLPPCYGYKTYHCNKTYHFNTCKVAADLEPGRIPNA